MKPVRELIVGLLGLFVASAALAEAPLKPIFDGKTFEGWDRRGGANFAIEDGVIVGTTGGGGHGWLCTSRSYGDFILEVEVKSVSGNSGIQVRSRISDRDVMVGYQIEVDPTARAWSGGLFEQGRRGWLQDLRRNEPARQAFKNGEWNHYRIVCIGDSIRSWVNGIPVADYVDSMDVEGIIALQVHSGRGVRAEFRNIRLADLGKHSWQPAWNGTTLEGFRVVGKGQWDVVDGAIRGRHSKGDSEFGYLVSEATRDDFTMRFQFKDVQGNSGFIFRAVEGGTTGIRGLQAQIDAGTIGGLYESGERGWLVRPEAALVTRAHRPGEWNTMTVSARGERVVVNLNGTQMAEFRDTGGRPAGHFALQVHGNEDVEILVKGIEVLQKGGAPGVTITRQETSLRVDVNGELFTEYHFAGFDRPILYPILGPHGTEMMRHFPMKDVAGESRDHRHHRSLWYAHGNVNGVDFWLENARAGKVVHKELAEASSGEKGLIRTLNDWVDATGKIICTDERITRIHSSSVPRVLDFEITIKASHGDVVFGDTKEGTMAFRMVDTMKSRSPGQGTIINSAGQRNDDTWGKRAEWCYYYGPVAGKTLGIGIFDHPSNPRHPTWWHVRDYGLFAANPFGLNDFERLGAGAGDFKIPSGESATFRYRFVFHEGDETAAGISDLYKAYAGEKP